MNLMSNSTEYIEFKEMYLSSTPGFAFKSLQKNLNLVIKHLQAIECIDAEKNSIRLLFYNNLMPTLANLTTRKLYLAKLCGFFH